MHMAETILMPKQGNTVESCIILDWKKQEGDKIAVGEIICEVETDKATIEVESTAEGTILKLLYEVDDDVPVQVPIAIVGNQGEDFSDLIPSQDTPDIREEAEPAQEKTDEPVKEQEPAQPAAANVSTQQFVSPRARNRAEELGVDPATLTGSGAKGRVIEQDVLENAGSRQPLTPAAREAGKSSTEAVPAQGTGIGGRVRREDLVQRQSAADTAADSYTDIPVRSIRKITAERMRESLATTAQLTMDASADARALLSLRKRFKNSDQSLGLSNVTINDIVLYAVAHTLKDFPSVNSHFLGETIREFNHVNLGFAVDTPKGLMVPVVKGADRLSLKEIAVQAKDLNQRCQTGKISPEDLSDGTSTVTNLGSFGVERFTPVLNIPQTAIFGICAISRKPVEENGEVSFIPHIGISMTYDHQSLDGAPAARFLKQLVTNIAQIDLLLAV
jgi:pyruvate dehydrogenase E2 component (dihydrolipoamide acetyltransferase)